jgi:hypothetical protein
MSYLVTFIGKPEAIKRKLAETSSQLTGGSKDEFDAVRPALETVLDLNVGQGIVRLEASGHAGSYRAAGAPPDSEPIHHSNCQVHITVLGQIAE